MQRITGTFEPPHDIAGLRLYRLVGPGCLDVSTLGLGASGMAVDRPVRYNARVASVAVILGGSLLAIATGLVGQIMPVVTVAGALLWLWQSWKEAEKRLLRWTVPWPGVEHILQIPQQPDRFAVILAANPAHPETLYFTPTDGPEALLSALREHAPAAVPVETAAAAQAALDEAAAEERPEEEEDSPWAPRV
jgi:hypothetical protein